MRFFGIIPEGYYEKGLYKPQPQRQRLGPELENMEPTTFLTSCGASALANITTSAVKKIAREVRSKSLESLFVNTFLVTLNYHDKHYDKVSRKMTGQLRRAVKKDRSKLVHIFARNSDNLQTFLTPIKKRQFQKKVVQEIVTEYSLEYAETNGLVFWIVIDCLELYQRAFLEQMSQQQALQTILIQTLKLDSVLAGIEQIKSKLDRRLIRRRADFPVEQIRIQPKVSLAKLPTTGPLFLGRQKELRLLDKAWKTDHVNVVSIVAWGGVGKTAMVNAWLNRLERDSFRGARRVLGYSFYSQGAAEGKQASADPFINFALQWFGDPDPTKGTFWEKGERLAELVRQEPTLLIIDGLEPLQHPHDGSLKDMALKSLLKELAHQNPGVCVITTRLQLSDIDSCVGTSVIRKPLERISKQDSVRLLKKLGARGSKKDLEKASNELQGHALALTLLARYVSVRYNGDIRQRDKIGKLTKEKKQGEHTRKIMAAYARWYARRPELNILYIMGLFDRPAEQGAIEKLRAKPSIKGLTLQLQRLSEDDWQEVVHNLREVGLLSKQYPNSPYALDCHPLVREYFGEKLEKNNPQAWKQAHSRLYEYYKGLPEKLYGKFLPDTLEEMEPLFTAVAHGCMANRYEEVFNDVLMSRICCLQLHCIKIYGAFGSMLGTLRFFFKSPWSELTDSFGTGMRSFLFNAVGHCLRALGRLREATSPLEAAKNISVEQRSWLNAYVSSDNLAQVLLALGQVRDATVKARETIEYADYHGQCTLRCAARLTLIEALHQGGYLREATKALEEVNRIVPEYGWYVYALSGSRCSDLLLSSGKWTHVHKLTIKALYLRKTEDSLKYDHLTIGLEYLMFGLANLIAVLHGREEGLTDARSFLDRGVKILLEHGDHEFLPHAFIARAEMYRYQRDFDKAWGDLEEAAEIAERGEMNLYMADYYLESARLCLAEGITEKARENYEEAAKRVEDMGYHRRDPEVLLIQAELEIVEGKQAAAKKTLKATERRIGEMGCHRWDIEVERLQNII